MSQEVSSRLARIESKLVKASKSVAELKKDRDMLKLENQQLKSDLADESLKRKSIEEQYERLKLVKSLVSHTDDKTAMKFRVNELVKEIDKCLALLNR